MALSSTQNYRIPQFNHWRAGIMNGVRQDDLTVVCIIDPCVERAGTQVVDGGPCLIVFPTIFQFASATCGRYLNFAVTGSVTSWRSIVNYCGSDLLGVSEL